MAESTLEDLDLPTKVSLMKDSSSRPEARAGGAFCSLRSLWLFDVPLLGLGAAIAWSAAAAQDPVSAHRTLAWLLSWIGMALVIGHAGRSTGLWRTVAYPIVIGGTSVAVYYVAQYSYLEVGQDPALIALGRLPSAFFPQVAPGHLFQTVWRRGWKAIPLAFGLALDRRSHFPRCCFPAALDARSGADDVTGAWMAVAAAAVCSPWARSVSSVRGFSSEGCRRWYWLALR